MPNSVLESLRAQRAEQIAAMDAVLSQIEGRDLVDAERGLLEASRERITALDAQIEPLEAYENMAAAHRETQAALGAPGPASATMPHRMAAEARGMEYRSAGAFMVDYLRANGIMERGIRDESAANRIIQTRAVADQTTGDTPGLLPTPIIGAVVSIIDSNRPLITSLGARGLGGIPGTTFSRPKITQHTTVGVQATQKTQLSSQKMTVAGVNFTKATYGGTVDISRQDIDWTSPSAWDILIRDLAEVYSVQTETAIAAAFLAAATGTKPVLPATPVLLDWAKAIYTAGMHSYQGGQRMPKAIWCSLDVWAALGSLVDTTRVVIPVDTTREMGAPGTQSLRDFSGDLFGLPRIVVPTFAAKTCIVGPIDLYEVYEEVIGLLSVVEPSILGVQVAYGGYVAYGTLAGSAYVPLDLSAVTTLPTAMEAEDIAAADAEALEAQEAEREPRHRRASTPKETEGPEPTE
jgi:HK97 family phage major capsid protein